MVSQTSFTFIYATGSAYLSVESDVSRNELKIGCLGLASQWSVADHTWDYPLDERARKMLEDFETSSGFREWEESYVSEDGTDLDWEFIVTYDDGSKRRSFGKGMKAPGFDECIARMREIVITLSEGIYIDLSPLEAVYFCYVRNGIYCATTLYRDIDSTFEKTKVTRGEKTFRLEPAQWETVVRLVQTLGKPYFGFTRVPGKQFASRALYLGGRMVSRTDVGEVDPVWEEFESAIMSILGLE
ncbi:MAG: hypothetical protein MJZ38_04875 [archaeon]|nr:hypothetical protein [archaeon]